jgi:superfamily II DNA/RNA helicase
VQSALQTAIVSPKEIPRGSNLKGSGSGFGSAERNIIWELGDENPKLIAIKDIIEKRETTKPKELSISGNSGNPLMPYNGANLRYKYIIFSKIVDNLMIIKDYLRRKAHIPEDAFGEIHGKISGDSVDERKRRAEKFNEGTTRIMLISEAAEEGVDFKRASVVILAEPVYNWSEYVQIRGRAVRTNSAKPPNDEEKLKNIPDSHRDKLVAENIESFIVVFNKSYPRPGQAEKLSWDMTSFKQMYTKKFELEEFSKEIQPYFFPNGAIANSTSRILHF